jgi:surface antigen
LNLSATGAGDYASQTRDAPAWWGGAVPDRVSYPVEVARLLSTQLNLKSGGCILSLALLGGITLSGGAVPVETIQASATPLSEQSWLTFAGPWLCRAWTDGATKTLNSDIGSGVSFTAEAMPSPVSLGGHGNEPSQIKAINPDGALATAVSTVTSFGTTYGDTTIHCTRKWHVDSLGYLISDAPNWVSNATGTWPATNDVPDWLAHNHRQINLVSAAARIKPKPKPKVHKAPPKPVYQTLSSSANSTPAAPVSGGGGTYSPWAPVPGHPSYSMGDFAGDPNSSYFGYCTWYAWYRYQGEPLMRLGNAEAWAWNAPSFGLRTGTTPVVGATAVFQPGVEGAGGAGHVAHVEAVLGGGWFIVSEMNFSWNGGGWGRVDWRYVYATSGVTFIY